MQWLIDIVKEWIESQGYALQSWVQAQGYLTKGFVDRGDPDGWDWETEFFQHDNDWHTLSLSNICDPYAKSVLLHVLLQGSEVERDAAFRDNENTHDYNISRITSQTANISISADIVVPMDSQRRIQYSCSMFGITLLKVTVKGWWF